MLLYRAGTRQRRYAALAAEPRCGSDFNLHQAPLIPTLLTQFLSHTTTPTGWALLLSPEPWLVSATKVYSGLGADIVMESFHQRLSCECNRLL
jgi:hypothetical protein